MVSLDFDVKINVRETMQAFDKLTSKEVPEAIAMSMNKIAGAGRRAVTSQMAEVFDSPNAWTLGAFRVANATPDHLEAAVATKDMLGQAGRHAYEYLKVQDEGGFRPMKASERALRTISDGQYWLPGPDAPLDSRGNIRGGEILRIMSRLGLMQDPTANITDRTARRLARKGMVARGQRSEYFIGRERGNGRPTGVYKYVAPGRVAQILIFTPRAPHYTPIISFEKIVADVVAQETDRMIGQAVRYTLKKRLE